MYRMDGRKTLLAGQIAGDFTLPRDPRQKLVFIAGGIGITPFRSMLKYLLDVQQRRDIALFYINKAANEIVYTDVLNAAQATLAVKAFYTFDRYGSCATLLGWLRRQTRCADASIRRARLPGTRLLHIRAA